MYRKKAPLFIVTILLLSMVLTGCNADTLGLISHMEEMQTVATTKSTQTISKVSINNINIPTDTLGPDEKALVKTMTQHMNSSYITITQKSDPKKNISSLSFDLVQKKDNKAENLVVLKSKDESLSLTVGPKLNELYPGADILLTPINNKLIPLSMLQAYFSDSPIVLNTLNSSQSLEGIEKKAITYLDELLAIYKQSDSNIITKDGNAFILQLDTNEFIKLMDTLVTFTLKNFDPILDKTIKFMDSLTVEEFNTMYSTTFPEGKAEVVKILKEAKAEYAKEGVLDEVLLMWNETYPEVSDMMSTMFKGSSLRMRTWKENDNYYTNLNSIIKIADPYETKTVLDTNILIEEETKVITEDFDVTMPTEKISKELLDSIFGYDQM